MKNILVATDFSNNAYCVLFYAAKLLEYKKCTFYLLNTFLELTPSKKHFTTWVWRKKTITATRNRIKGKAYQYVP